MLLSARTESNQRCAKGCVSEERLAKQAFQVAPPPGPPFYGGCPAGRWVLAPGGSGHKTLRPSCLGDTGPYCVGNLRVSALYAHRLHRNNRGSRAVAGHLPDDCRTKQVGKHQAVYVRTAHNRGPRQSPAKRVWWGEEEQGSDMTDAHEWASGIKRTLRRRGPCGPRVKGRTVKT